MKIKQSSLDAFLIMLVMFVTILPLFIAKQLVILSLSFLAVRIITSKDIFFYVKQKIIIFILLIPGILGVIFFTPENLVRFSGILLIVLGFPFSSFKIKHFSIMVLSSLILLYLIATQILMLQGNQILLNFRDIAYHYELSYVHRYGISDDIIKNALNFNYGTVRSGGLYSNPNTLAGIVVIYFFIFDISWKYFDQIISYDKKKLNKYFYWSIFLLVLFCLMQTKSKTYLIAFSIYIIFQYLDVIDLLKLKIKKKSILSLILVAGISSLIFQKVMEGIFLKGGSINIKYSILFNYLENISIFNLIFGGTFEANYFDTEYGYWIGTSGLFGIVAFFIFYIMVYRFLPQSKALLISLLVISFGASLFYNLLLVSILIPLFVILLSSSKKLKND